MHDGVPISIPLIEDPVFPPMVGQMVRIGEETGELDKMLSKIADFYEDEVDASIAVADLDHRAAADDLRRRHGRDDRHLDVSPDVQAADADQVAAAPRSSDGTQGASVEGSERPYSPARVTLPRCRSARRRSAPGARVVRQRERSRRRTFGVLRLNVVDMAAPMDIESGASAALQTGEGPSSPVRCRRATRRGLRDLHRATVCRWARDEGRSTAALVPEGDAFAAATRRISPIRGRAAKDALGDQLAFRLAD